MDVWLDFLANLIALLRSGHLPEWGRWSYLVLALLVAVEGPVATLLGAAAASAGLMRPAMVFLSASAGNLMADTLWYALGYMGKIEWFWSIGRRMGVTQAQLERLQHNMHQHAARILFMAKLSMSLMIPSLIAAGLVKARWRGWFPAVFGGEIIWTGSLVLIGYYATEAIKRVEQGLEYVILAGSLVFVMFMLLMGRKIMRASATDGSETDGDEVQE